MARSRELKPTLTFTRGDQGLPDAFWRAGGPSGRGPKRVWCHLAGLGRAWLLFTGDPGVRLGTCVGQDPCGVP